MEIEISLTFAPSPAHGGRSTAIAVRARRGDCNCADDHLNEQGSSKAEEPVSTSQLDQTGRDLMLRAMISMAAADGHIADVEAATVSAIFEKVAGESIDTAEVLAAAYVLRTEESNMSAALSAAVGELDDFAREAILRAASLVLLADGKALAPERERLVEMAEALQTPEPRVAALLEGLPD